MTDKRKASSKPASTTRREGQGPARAKREERLHAALRANLKRRKAPAKVREDATADQGDAEEGGE